MSEFKLKNTIGEETKMFWKYQLAVWLSMQNFYSHFTKVTRKCECFGRIVEPCIDTWIYTSMIICLYHVCCLIVVIFVCKNQKENLEIIDI